MKQKFKRGDLVRIAKDLGPAMSHFTADCNAIVIGSYKDQYGGGEQENTSYTVFIEGQGETSWYDESQLTFIRHAPTLLKQWQKQSDRAHRQRTNLKWVLKNWDKVKESAHADTILYLFDVFSISTNFHQHGEYYILFSEWKAALPMIDKFFSKLR